MLRGPSVEYTRLNAYFAPGPFKGNARAQLQAALSYWVLFTPQQWLFLGFWKVLWTGQTCLLGPQC